MERTRHPVYSTPKPHTVLSPDVPRSAASSKPRAAPLWLFPSPAELYSALSGKFKQTRQICCSGGRLAVLARGGTSVEVHLLQQRSTGPRKPKYIKLERNMKIYSMDQGAEHMLILSSDGKPFEYNFSIEHARFQCVLQEKSIIQIACGDHHSLALSKGGELFAWGQNLHGQLGVGRIVGSTSTPQIVTHLTGVPLVQISAGEAHSMALSMSGNIYSWGKNDFGQLGLGHTDKTDSPSLVEELDNQEVEFLTCGGSHTALLTKNGQVFTFGAGNYGQLGHNSVQNESRPRLVTELTGNRVTQIACGRDHTLAYVPDLGKVFSFGSGKEGQLGNGRAHNQLIPLPMKLPSKEELKFENCTSDKELIMIAGGNQTILLLYEKENSYVNLRRKIATLNEGTVKRWVADLGTKQWQSTKREIKEIFSSPACLIGSFLRKRITAESMSIHLDLNKARYIFKELMQKDQIANMITTNLSDNLLRNLPLHSPHQEALDIFCLLPEYLVMQDSNNWASLVVLFAEAVCSISDQSSRVLEKNWASLPESTFVKLIHVLKRAILSQQHYWTKSDNSYVHIQALLETMEKLHRVNQTKHKLPENNFHIDELSHLLNFHEAAYRRSCWSMNWEFPEDTSCYVTFSHFPFVFNILSKTKLLNADSELKRSKWSKTFLLFHVKQSAYCSTTPLMAILNLIVRRDNLVDDAFNQLKECKNEDLRKELRVSFSGEFACDLGGVRNEFFHCIFEKMTQPEYGMFMYPEEGSYMWFPVKPKFEGQKYFFFGVLCGLSLFNSNVANIPFPLALFKKLLDQPPSLEDFKELSPVWGKCLQTLLDYEEDDFGEVFHIHFDVPWDKNKVELIPNGEHIMVDQTSKRDYVSKFIDYVFNISVKPIYEEFQRGFYSVCDEEIIEIFHPEELKDVIIGNTDYDWEMFEKNACYEFGYTSSHPTIVMFWKALHKLTLEEKKKFLEFLTGTDRLQIKGLKNMNITFCCLQTWKENDPIRAQTCSNILYLPKYSTMERMEEALQVAINNSRGFGCHLFL
ncbi:PREDICTED: E3 ISG15--protein ligase HERC5 [Chrysochloris asiatica]|uniref:E3 ISG15--protein ligase HERC5 n=1 Tax=Chrysochloris asiatica TaxID=185453 RepID=A0A9B0TP15_CHRAS|nr:PREDICTED: E3 ISG15--protein ligase HERC5 [Chrysochloris asiatica]